MKNIKTITMSALILALTLVMPFVTMQIPQIGSRLLPMHLPVLLGGYLLGGIPAMAVGFIAPLLRHLLFSMPPLMTAVAMAFELAAYGLVAGLMYTKSKKTTADVYISLIAAMIAGRLVWGVVSFVIYTMAGNPFTLQIFMADAFLNAVPGIILQIILIPVLVQAMKRAGLIDKK